MRKENPINHNHNHNLGEHIASGPYFRNLPTSLIILFCPGPSLGLNHHSATSCGTMGKLLNVSESQFAHL